MEMTTARTEDKPVEKLAQCKLIKLNPWLDWSRIKSEDSLFMVFVTERSASSWNYIGGAGVVVDVEVLSHPFILLSDFLVDRMG